MGDRAFLLVLIPLLVLVLVLVLELLLLLLLDDQDDSCGCSGATVMDAQQEETNRTCRAVASREGRKTAKIPKKNGCQTFVLLPWKIDDFVDEVGAKNGTADYADYTDF